MSDYVIQFGKKYKGRNISGIPIADLQNYIDWLDQSDIKPGSYMENNLTELKKAFDALPKTAVEAVPIQETETKNASGRKPAKTANKNSDTKRIYMTSGGTELPLLDFKGKEYLEVKYRLVWFREEHPDWRIETSPVEMGEQSAIFKATIFDESGNAMATSHKCETLKGFPDFMEKAETGAIGRALALLGYGTQFCADDLDEGERIVDTPVGHGGPRTMADVEAETPSVENGPVVAVTLLKRNKKTEEMLRKRGFMFDWQTFRYLAYKDHRFNYDDLGLDYEILEKKVSLS